MDIKVTTTKVKIDNESLNKGEYNIRECNFDLAEEFTGLVCKALFTISKTKLTYEQSIVNGKCDIPYEATVNRGKVIVGVIGYEIEDEELVKRYSPEPDEFFVLDGSYIEDIENQSTPTPSELEQLEQRVSQVEIDAAQVEINKQDISDIKQEQTTQNNDILLRSLITETGSQIELSLNTTNFKMTATLKDKNGTVVNTSNEIDLPLESVVVNASYDSSTKELVLTLQNGNTVRFSVADLVSGLVSDTDYATTSKAGVIKTSNALGTQTYSADGILRGTTRTYAQYQSDVATMFVSKGTLENVITGKGLVSRTDYAATNDAGVVKVNSYSSNIDTQGKLRAASRDYNFYLNSMDNYHFIGKGTLENVITGKQLVNETQLNTKADKSSLVTGSGENITLQNTAELEFLQPPLPGGNSKQVQYSGKNKLNNTGLTEQKTINGITATPNEDGSVTLNGTSTATTFFNLTNTQNFGTTDFSSANNASDSYKATLENSTGYASLNYTHGNTTTAIRISNGITINNVTVYPMILLKSETNESYEPYCGGTASPNPSFPSPITNVTGDVEVLVQNKNRFDYDYASDYSHTTVDSYRFVKIADVVKGQQYNINNLDISDIENETSLYIYITSKPNYEGITSGNSLCYGSNKLYTTNTSLNAPTTNSYYIGIYPSNINETTFNKILDKFKNAQLEQGSTASTYTPHQEQTFTFPLGTQRMFLGDYLADDGIHHVRKQITLDGSSDEDWSHYSNSSAPYRLVINDIKPSSSDNIIPNVKCTHFEAVKWNADFNTYTYLLTMHSNNNYLAFRDTDITSLADWKTWLSTHNVTIEYELAEETVEPYTTEQQQAYDEIKQALSYEEQTNISGTSDEANPIFEVQAVQYKEPDYWTIAYVNAQIGNAIGGAY